MITTDKVRSDALLDYLYDAGADIHDEISGKVSGWRNERDHSLFLAYIALKRAIDSGIVEVSPEFVRF